jgi:hypothetical protein
MREGGEEALPEKSSTGGRGGGASGDEGLGIEGVCSSAATWR